MVSWNGKYRIRNLNTVNQLHLPHTADKVKKIHAARTPVERFIFYCCPAMHPIFFDQEITALEPGKHKVLQCLYGKRQLTIRPFSLCSSLINDLFSCRVTVFSWLRFVTYCVFAFRMQGPAWLRDTPALLTRMTRRQWAFTGRCERTLLFCRKCFILLQWRPSSTGLLTIMFTICLWCHFLKKKHNIHLDWAFQD